MPIHIDYRTLKKRTHITRNNVFYFRYLIRFRNNVSYWTLQMHNLLSFPIFYSKWKGKLHFFFYPMYNIIYIYTHSVIDVVVFSHGFFFFFNTISYKNKSQKTSYFSSSYTMYKYFFLYQNKFNYIILLLIYFQISFI